MMMNDATRRTTAGLVNTVQYLCWIWMFNKYFTVKTFAFKAWHRYQSVACYGKEGTIKPTFIHVQTKSVSPVGKMLTFGSVKVRVRVRVRQGVAMFKVSL